MKVNESKLQAYILKIAKKYRESKKEDRIKVGQRINCHID